MSERALRGSRLGATSYEHDRDVDLAPRLAAEFRCPRGHEFRIPFAAEADLPTTWECRVCGEPARRTDASTTDTKPVKPARTHWDMLLERRSIAELEELLAERLDLLRTGAAPGTRKSA